MPLELMILSVLIVEEPISIALGGIPGTTLSELLKEGMAV